jgi:hypothetical protein
MVEGEVAAAVAQFGVAGLVAWMWLTERRSGSTRERQISELHERLMRERRETEVLIAALGDNTRALASLEAGQRGLVAMLGRLVEGRVERAG